jgi:type I restriction enzyme S subunit
VTENSSNLPQLPKGWVWTRLRDVGNVGAGGTPSTGDSENFNGDVPWITPADLSGFNGKFISMGRRNLSKKGLSSSSAVLLPAGTVLFSSRAPIGYVAIATNPVSTNQGFKNLTCNDDIFNEYVFYYLKANKRLAESYGSGTTFTEVSASRFAKIPFPLCPLNEQRRIVGRIEELFSCLDAGVESLLKVKTLLKRYRQAVLKYAFEGKLTEEWRKTNKDIVEPASALLQRILKNRHFKWESNYFSQLKVKGIMPEGDRWTKKYKELIGPEITNLPGLPERWIWVNLGQLVWSVRDGPHFSPEYVDQGIPFITGGNVRPSGVDFDSSRRISPELHRRFAERCKPEMGDILYTKGGTTGIARVNTYAREFSVWVHVAVLKLAEPIEPFYVQHVLNSPFCYEQAQRFTHGVGNQDLGLTRMIRIILPLPPLAEQKEIVAEIDRLQSITDEVERIVQTNYEYAENLRQVILIDAFSGKLVSQDPRDEPADRLLERIKAEKAKFKDKKNTNEEREKPKPRELSSYVK